SPFFAPLKLALFAAVLVTIPWLLYQAWAFVAPGLYRREKRLALPLLVSYVAKVFAGCAIPVYLLPTYVLCILPAIASAFMAILVSAVALYVAGIAFAFFLVLTAVFGFLTAVTPDGVAMMTDINAYLNFVLVIFLAFGISFELPVALVILVALGWVTPGQLRE